MSASRAIKSSTRSHELGMIIGPGTMFIRIVPVSGAKHAPGADSMFTILLTYDKDLD